MPRGKASKLSNNPKQMEEWLNNIPNVEDLYTQKSYEEISSALESWINGDDEAIESEGTEHPTTTQTTDTTTSTRTSTLSKDKNYDNLDDAFADLMD
jgi:hypothetical protein